MKNVTRQTGIAWVAFRNAHAKPIQTLNPFQWVFGWTLANGPIRLFDSQIRFCVTYL